MYDLYSILSNLHSQIDGDLQLEELRLQAEASATGHEEAQKAYHSAIQQASESKVGEGTIRDVLVQLKNKSLLREASIKAFEASEGDKDALDELLHHIEEVRQSDASDPSEQGDFVTDDLQELYVQTYKAMGLRWRLDSLNKSLGSLRKGDFGFVFARPETGKTTFLASEVSHMASQVDRPILWFNNEEQGNKVMLRIYEAALGLPIREVFSTIDVHKSSFQSLTKGNIKLYDSANISFRNIDEMCKRFNPSLVVIDQIDKVGGFDDERKDLQLGAIYQWARELAKTYCPVIGVCQADGTGEGVKWLTMAHVANAKTAKQAEADWILGIGKTNDEGLGYIRHINISKNKLFGDEDSIEDLRHGRFDVIIEPTIARYKDVLKF